MAAAGGKPRRGYRTCSRCHRNRAVKFFTPKGRICSSCKKSSRSTASHEVRVQELYGLLPGEYEELLSQQGGGCAICGGKRRGHLDVDHDHKTGLVRGLLCAADNRKVLKYARDDPQRLRNAAAYLERPPAQYILGERLHRDFRED